jgi:Asp-tRNA(Asn)/Glu-tRNA(Gln) amidotransferase A subunit family amidase
MTSLLDTLRRVDAGDLTPDRAIAACREAIEARDKDLEAFVHVAHDPAAGRGPLAGIAVGVKDIIDTADMPTEMGSPIYAGWRPRADASVVAAFRRAARPSWARPPRPSSPISIRRRRATRSIRRTRRADRRPARPRRLGAGMIPLCDRTQTGGSVIRPASYCGVAAINRRSARCRPSA